MSDETIPCWVEISTENGELKLIPFREVTLRPGESAFFTVDPPQVVVHRVWFGRRWYVGTRAYLGGMRGPNLVMEEEERQ